MMSKLQKRSIGRVAAVLLLLSALVAVGCESRTDQVDSGGVLLSVSDFDALPFQVSVNNAAVTGFVSIGEITISSIAKNTGAPTSSLMNVEMSSYEVTYTRADTGTRVPAALVQQIFGVVPINGTELYENLPILLSDQLNDLPLADLLFQNGSFDRETGETSISINIRVRFFGRTLSGDEVETAPISFTVEFIP